MSQEEPWRLSPEQIHDHYLMGMELDGIEEVEAARKKRWDALMANDKFVEHREHGYVLKYGIDHKCHCAEDAFLGDLVQITLCEAHVFDLALAKLEETLIERDLLKERVQELEAT